jgi:hypothetical protein
VDSIKENLLCVMRIDHVHRISPRGNA